MAHEEPLSTTLVKIIDPDAWDVGLWPPGIHVARRTEALLKADQILDITNNDLLDRCARNCSVVDACHRHNRPGCKRWNGSTSI